MTDSLENSTRPQARDRFEDFGVLSIPERKMRAAWARKKGRSHLENGLPCQDHCLVRELADNILFAAVADGHGGEEYIHSDRGAALACETLYRLTKETLFRHKVSGLSEAMRDSAFRERFCESWNDAVLKEHEEAFGPSEDSKERILRQYGTTLLFAVAAPDFQILGQLGDGAILLFNGFGQGQLFCRHLQKRSSVTASLASKRAACAMHIDIYEKSAFRYILLSSDGVYDRLDRNDAFLRYGQTLAKELCTEGFLRTPFCVEDKEESESDPPIQDRIDVSEISHDDCTVVLLCEEEETAHYALPDALAFEEPTPSFKRFFRGLTIFGTKEQLLSPNRREWAVTEGGEVFGIEVSGDAASFQELSEYGAFLEKRYDQEEAKQSFSSNGFILKAYEALLELNREFTQKQVKLPPFYPELLFFTEDGNVSLLWDTGHDEGSQAVCAETQEMPLAECLSAFSVFGKLCCHGEELPLFRTKDRGQGIPFLCGIKESQGDSCMRDFQENPAQPLTRDCGEESPSPEQDEEEVLPPTQDEGEALLPARGEGETLPPAQDENRESRAGRVLGRVVYHPEKKIYGLWNLSGRPWEVLATDNTEMEGDSFAQDFQEDPTRPLSRDHGKVAAVISPLGVLRLTQDCAFRILDEQPLTGEKPVYQVYLYPAY
ncbi:MAG: protein phosphatase 2C domain-containing protein [Lachnospiraceae bacterium]|nr:protein phosphatase 2C domain-containing protein [Lachnospiraceae bacterium]